MTSQETTFTGFTPAQAAQYAVGRGGSYPAQLYQTILDYHQGPLNLLLDAGCGPGKAVWDLVPPFKYAIGTDSSAGMIEQARKDALQRDLANQTSFSVYVGEECDQALLHDANAPQKTADVLTVAMAAHWMDMSAFYQAAERALTPGGTLAIWTCSSLYIHPSTPNAAALQDALRDLEDNMLADYHNPGVKLTRGGYEALPLPWDIKGLESSGFKKETFVRKEWDRDGVPSAPNRDDGSPGPFLMGERSTLESLGKGLGSASSVIRWREAHPDKVGTEDDAVEVTIRRLRERSGGSEDLIIAGSLSLLLMRKA